MYHCSPSGHRVYIQQIHFSSHATTIARQTALVLFLAIIEGAQYRLVSITIVVLSRARNPVANLFFFPCGEKFPLFGCRKFGLILHHVTPDPTGSALLRLQAINQAHKHFEKPGRWYSVYPNTFSSIRDRVSTWICIC